jgi:hypothetical protein
MVAVDNMEPEEVELELEEVEEKVMILVEPLHSFQEAWDVASFHKYYSAVVVVAVMVDFLLIHYDCYW